MAAGGNVFFILGQQNINPFPNKKNLDHSELKKSAGDNFKFDERNRKCSKGVENTVGKGVENTVGKGEIARYEQFLIFPQCFQKPGLVWGRA